MAQANVLVKALKVIRGKIVAPVHSTHDTMHLVIEKQYLIQRLEALGDHECGYCLYLMDDEVWCFGSES